MFTGILLLSIALSTMDLISCNHFGVFGGQEEESSSSGTADVEDDAVAIIDIASILEHCSWRRSTAHTLAMRGTYNEFGGDDRRVKSSSKRFAIQEKLSLNFCKEPSIVEQAAKKHTSI